MPHKKKYYHSLLFLLRFSSCAMALHPCNHNLGTLLWDCIISHRRLLPGFAGVLYYSFCWNYTFCYTYTPTQLVATALFLVWALSPLCMLRVWSMLHRQRPRECPFLGRVLDPSFSLQKASVPLRGTNVCSCPRFPVLCASVCRDVLKKLFYTRAMWGLISFSPQPVQWAGSDLRKVTKNVAFQNNYASWRVIVWYMSYIVVQLHFTIHVSLKGNVSLAL